VIVILLIISGIALLSGGLPSRKTINPNLRSSVVTPDAPVATQLSYMNQLPVSTQLLVATSTLDMLFYSLPSVTSEPSLTLISTSSAISENSSALDGMEMEYVPASDFLMGVTNTDQDFLYSNCPTCDRTSFDDAAQRRIYLDEYWIDKTEVTIAQFAKFVNAAGYITSAEKQGWSLIYVPSTNNFNRASDRDWLHPKGILIKLDEYGQYPVMHVSWNDANAYCAWVHRRLPTEAEWEKAARGTDGRLFPWGNSLPTPQLENSNPYKYAVPVGSYLAGASPYGVLDMIGNVWEWTSDYYQQYYYTTMPGNNPPSPLSGENRVVRGGSWGTFINTELVLLSSAYRFSDPPGYSSDLLGFRCATSSKP
jgi:formylglycine-generating enzyme required for sulfatase activity